MAELLFLGRVLAGIEQFPARHALLLPADEEWDEHTRCAVLPLSDEDDEAPPFAAEHGLEYALGVYAVQGVVANARLQVPAPATGCWWTPSCSTSTTTPSSTSAPRHETDAPRGLM